MDRMTPEDWQKFAKENGISRESFEKGFAAEPSFSDGKQPPYLCKSKSMVPDRPPIKGDFSHLITTNTNQRGSRAWWAGLTKEERDLQRAKRVANGKRAHLLSEHRKAVAI